MKTQNSPLTEIYNPHNVLGKSKCRLCRLDQLHKWRLNNPERVKELDKKYRELNPENNK